VDRSPVRLPPPANDRHLASRVSSNGVSLSLDARRARWLGLEPLTRRVLVDDHHAKGQEQAKPAE
jgi:hypothetical protein